jgi:hypothetical protein
VYPLVLKVLDAGNISPYILKELVSMYDEQLSRIVSLCLYRGLLISLYFASGDWSGCKRQMFEHDRRTKRTLYW